MNYSRNSSEEGIQDDIIIRHEIDFFECGVTANAKNEFGAKVVPNNNCPRRIGTKAFTNNVKDILDLIKKIRR